MESLVTLLVLSIGLLGLGQLQARLWVNAGDLHSYDRARLLAANIAELYEINSSILSGNQENAEIPVSDTSSKFNYQVVSSSTDGTITNKVQVTWERPGGRDTSRLNSTIYTAFRPVDARWLGQPYIAPCC